MIGQVKTKGVFFDLYGTLLIYGDMEAAWSDWLTALRGCLQLHGLSMAQEDFAERCDGFFSRKLAFSGNDGNTKATDATIPGPAWFMIPCRAPSLNNV